MNANYRFRGKDLDTLTREEAILALKQALDALKDAQSPFLESAVCLPPRALMRRVTTAGDKWE